MVQPNASVAKEKKKRSPAYPGIPFEEAINKAEAIRKAEGKNEANVDTILAHWDYRPKSGAGLVALSALIKFGLMTDNGSGQNRKIRLTDLALKILLDDRPESAERLALIREAALAPSIHKEIWDKYQGALPSDLTLRFFLRQEKGFQDHAADDLIRDFRKTLAYAKLGESANITLEGNNKPKPEGDMQMAPTLTEPKTPATSVPASETTGGKPSIVVTVKQIQIPLTGTTWAIIQVPVPMSEENWQELQDFLKLMKKPITGSASTTQAA